MLKTRPTGPLRNCTRAAIMAVCVNTGLGSTGHVEILYPFLQYMVRVVLSISTNVSRELDRLKLITPIDYCTR